MQKLYCYVDESGQDERSQYFVVVVVIVSTNRDDLQQKLLAIETFTQTNSMKWHKTRHERRIHYLNAALERRIPSGGVFFGRYKKPLPYFFPMSEVLEKAIKRSADSTYTSTVYVDGIDKTIAKKLTNVLRARRVHLKLVKQRREENEPLIRLADMWAGCIRGALLRGEDSQKLLARAQKESYLQELT